jgi:hypothetical protein
MANKTLFLFTSLLAMIMILLVGCGNTAVSRRNFTPPPGYKPAKLWIAHHIPPHHAYFEGVGHNKKSYYFAEFVTQPFSLTLNHHTYTIPTGSSIQFTFSSPSSSKIEMITIKNNKILLKIDKGVQPTYAPK